jgi:hypothetical protein
MLIVWCMAWMAAMMDPMGLNALRHEALADRQVIMERGPANAALARLQQALGEV